MNPYGIQQVDVPGLLSVYQGARQARAQEMLAKKQAEAAEKQADRDQRFGEILAKSMGGAGGAFGGQPQQPAGGAMGATEAFGQPPAQPTMNPAPRPNLQLRPETMAQLVAVDPDEAFKVFQAFGQMSEQQHKQSQRVNETLGRAAQHLLTVPENERQAEIQRIAPILMEQGIEETMISQFAPTERNLQFLIAQSRDIEKLREEFLPKLVPLEAGAGLYDVSPVNRGEVPRVVVAPNTGQGQFGDPATPPQSEAELRAAADEAIRQGADPAAVNARLQQMLGGGGGGNATGNFPQPR